MCAMPGVMALLKPHWGLWLFTLLVASEQPTTVTKDNEQVADDNKYGTLVAVETEDDEEPVPSSEKEFGRDVYDRDMEIFQATHQWQTVRQGQAIPPGLHVRLNLQTGRREAKLLDDTTQEEPPQSTSAAYITQGSPDRVQRMKAAIQQAMQQLDNDETSTDDKEKGVRPRTDDKEGIKNLKEKYFTRDELKDALKKFKAEKISDKEMQVKTKYRNMEELKKEFAEMNAVMKSDLEILEELLEKYKQSDLLEDDLRTILTDLEYYLHQIDNAQNFVTLGGLECVMRDLNHTSEVIRSETAVVLGSAVQGNPRVQVAAMEVGAMQQLVRMLSLEPSIGVRSHVLYALSALVRHFPHAQQRFLELGGLHALKALFSQPDTATLRLRAVTLVNDMLVEQKAILHQTSSDATQQEKIRQYQNVPLLEAVGEQGWCHLVSSLLSLPEHDAREKVLHAMSTLSSLCHSSFTGARTLLMTLRTEYKNLALTESEEDDDTYFRDMVTLVDLVIKDLIVVKTEL